MTTPSKSIPEISVDAQTLAAVLESAQPGDVVPYATLTQAIRRDVQGKGYGVLTTARNVLLREKQIVFEAVTNVGLKRLLPSEIVAVGNHSIRRIGRIASRGVRKLACIGDGYETLSADDKIRHNAHISMLGAVKLMSSHNSVKKLEGVVRASSAQLPSADVLTLFAK